MKKIIIILLSVLLLIVLTSGFLYWRAIQPQKLGQIVELEIESGDSLNQISQRLAEKKIISSPFIFKFWAVVLKKSSKLQPGQYHFYYQTNIFKTIELLVQGVKQEEKITILEGWRTEQIALFLSEKLKIDANEFSAAAKETRFKAKYDFLEGVPTGHYFEGFFFPDTYYFNQGSTASEIVERMLKNFEIKIWLKHQEKFSKSKLTPFQIINLASIVERESLNDEERPVIAGIFLNRLEDEMRLEADPTVQYIKETQNQPTQWSDFWQKITVEDYQIYDSEFNTYKINGLPKTPIANPGEASISAVLEPRPTDYFYFFHTSKGDTHFSKTLEEHNQKKSQFLR